jgi:Flp pilus assembly protein TadG
MEFMERNRISRGQSLLEFALVLPILILLIFGVLDLGRIFYTTIALRGSVREGARYFSSHPREYTNTLDIVQNNAGGYGVNLESIEILCGGDFCLANECNVCDVRDTLTVRAKTEFDLITGLFFPSPIEIEQSTQMMILVDPN